MIGSPVGGASVAKTTSHRVITPFYVYGALAFLVGAILLFTSSDAFTGHHFQPHILAITHTMALGWATMVILGASHQLVPVLIEADLYSERMALLSFGLAGAGIPLLVYGFYTFNLGWPAKLGAWLVVVAMAVFLANLVISISKSQRENVHAVFVFTAVLWLLLTITLGLLMLYGLTSSTHLLPRDSLHYLSLHAHLGIVGWFLLLVLGVGSRLIPLFLISKYKNEKLLYTVYGLVNAALLTYTLGFLLIHDATWPARLALALITAGLALFVVYCRKAYQQRLRRKVDDQMHLALLSVGMFFLPVIIMFVLVAVLMAVSGPRTNLVLLYGFSIFFGWLTAIILGMTFKTLPFIIWNKVFKHRAALGKMPGPKDLFSHPVFRAMGVAYVVGFLLFSTGILMASPIILKTGAGVILLAAILYNFNIGKLATQKVPRR